MPSRECSTTCPSPPPCTESPTSSQPLSPPPPPAPLATPRNCDGHQTTTSSFTKQTTSLFLATEKIHQQEVAGRSDVDVVNDVIVFPDYFYIMVLLCIVICGNVAIARTFVVSRVCQSYFVSWFKLKLIS